jgi:hypothetical protein
LEEHLFLNAALLKLFNELEELHVADRDRLQLRWPMLKNLNKSAKVPAALILSSRQQLRCDRALSDPSTVRIVSRF